MINWGKILIIFISMLYFHVHDALTFVFGSSTRTFGSKYPCILELLELLTFQLVDDLHYLLIYSCP